MKKAKAAVINDVGKLVFGYILMFLYTCLMLGQQNIVETKFYLTLAGIVSIIMGIIMAMGIIQTLGATFSSEQQIAYLLCLG